MGGSKETVVSNTTSTSTPTPSAEETALNKLELQRQRELFGPGMNLQKQGMSLASQLLGGSTDLPGFIGDLGQGIGEEQTADIVKRSLEDIRPGFQSSGIFDSGVRAELEARTAGDIRRQTAEFNIGNRLNLLNLALSGQAQVQAPQIGFANQLSQRLSGLRSVNTSGTSNQVTSSPFNFGQAAGTAIGAAGLFLP